MEKALPTQGPVLGPEWWLQEVGIRGKECGDGAGQ